jgi:16S rRNA (adenine1518-N6/adenine1519-N6)-dimethyltransferase
VDAGLVRALRAEALLPANVELRHADALELDLAALVRELGAAGPVRLVANLPYSVASPLLRRLLDLRALLVDWSVMVQREVALRLLASPGSRDFGSLAVLHALSVRAERVLDLQPGCFHPAPRVVSSFVRFVPRADASLAPGELEAVERLARAAFSRRRKTLANALRDEVPQARLAAALAARGLDARVRPEQVPPEVWRALASELAAALGRSPGPAAGKAAHGA